MTSSTAPPAFGSPESTSAPPFIAPVLRQPPQLPATTKVVRRRRRPSGAPPPLPRKIGLTGKVWLGVFVAVLAWVVLAIHNGAVQRATDRGDTAVLRQMAKIRTGWLTTFADHLARIASGWAISGLALSMVAALMVLRRWRHLFTFLGAVAVLELFGSPIYDSASRPRPYGVTIIGQWAGFAMPSPPVAILTSFLIGAAYTLVVAGRPRTTAKIVIAVVVGIFVLARLYLAVDHPSDVVVGLGLAVAISVIMFRVFTPNDVFPVSYRRGKTAHLDVGGQRGDAIRRALTDQLGLTVVEIKPVGLEGSGGSTPLRLTVAGDPDTYLFGKLYSMTHVRADRWYKLGRTVLYGRLEDEAPFQSVRRLVEYEDYTARVLTDYGIPTAKAFGIVEITPEREYMLVTQFLDGAREIGDAEIDDGVIDEGLLIVRQLWDAGLAHRDIKPANLLVRDGHVYLIDAFFVQVRPSPWRQAVDLANMMLVLAVRTDAARVYAHALRLFTPDEIAEAFAATRGVASPTQLRAFMKRDGRNLMAEFRAMAPERRTVALQRWSLRRVLLAVAALGIALLFVTQVKSLLEPAQDLALSGSPSCKASDTAVLMAQAVPSATMVPCIANLPAGWLLGGVSARNGHASFWLDSDIAGRRALMATLRRRDRCNVASATPVPTDEVGTRRFEVIEQLPPKLHSRRLYLFDGGCVEYSFSFGGASTPAMMFALDQAVGFLPRSALVDHVRDHNNAALCGAGVTCPG